MLWNSPSCTKWWFRVCWVEILFVGYWFFSWVCIRIRCKDCNASAEFTGSFNFCDECWFEVFIESSWFILFHLRVVVAVDASVFELFLLLLIELRCKWLVIKFCCLQVQVAMFLLVWVSVCSVWVCFLWFIAGFLHVSFRLCVMLRVHLLVSWFSKFGV